jgi:hypothetical protein
MQKLAELISIEPVGFKWFAGLFLILVTALVAFLYVASGSYDFAGNRVSKDEQVKRERLQSENRCTMAKTDSARQVTCSRLSATENSELNIRLLESRFADLSDEALLSAATEMAESQIFWKSFEPELGGGGEKLAFSLAAIGIASFCLITGFLVLLVSIPTYLFSNDPARSRKAGGLAKSALGFIIAVGTAVGASFNIK